MSQEKIERWNEVDGNLGNKEKLQAFLDSTTDAYAILQLRRTDETVYERFESYEALKRQGKEPDIDHYDVVYMAPLSSYTDQTAMLEGLYTKFNVDRPEDFRGHSLSVSDIVALKTDAVVSFHYVDSIGFQELQGFMKPENYLKNAEMAMEDDYGMLDGVINNGKAPATEERSSVLAQLKEQPVLDISHIFREGCDSCMVICSPSYIPNERRKHTMMKKDWVYRRGDIYYADLNPVCGSEQGGKRPVVVIQNNIGNVYSPTLIVATITTKQDTVFRIIWRYSAC